MDGRTLAALTLAILVLLQLHLAVLPGRHPDAAERSVDLRRLGIEFAAVAGGVAGDPLR
jgi:hypothetical protein